mmetsp:Transcript_14764/g.32082  ORF Transcript_14764/g.32082 Transcript_14764/m.32082 type:complete len:90 (-) Transcript_14764:304-573(-)
MCASGPLCVWMITAMLPSINEFQFSYNKRKRRLSAKGNGVGDETIKEIHRLDFFWQKRRRTQELLHHRYLASGRPDSVLVNANIEILES